MNKSRLYIHIGTHKTGSTAIQHFLKLNDDLLRKQGVFYLRGFNEFGRLMTGKKVDKNIIATIQSDLESRVQLIKQKNQDSCFILSDEGFSGDPLIGYKNVEIVGKQLRQITKKFDVKIIVYLRRQDEFIESMYTQRIHQGESYSFKTFLDSLPFLSFNWQHLLTCYADFFGKENIIAHRYGKSYLPEQNSLMINFSQTIGINMQNILFHEESSQPNQGYSRDALEIARLSNPYLNSNEKKQLRQILQRISTKQLFMSYSYFSHEHRKKTISQYDESNGIVAREYFEESGKLFPFVKTDSINYPGLTIEAIAPVLTKAILSGHLHGESITVRILIKLERKIIALLSRYPVVISKLQSLSQKIGI